MLGARLGSDGYSTLLNGLSRFFDIDFSIVTVVVAVVLIGLAWVRGITPGVGSAVQPLFIGVVVTAMLRWVPELDSLALRWFQFGVGVVLVALGIAIYLAARAGAGPVEAPALAFDPPIPFKWGYGIMQLTCVLVGGLLGADVGLGTLIALPFLGPMANFFQRYVGDSQHAATRGQTV